MPVKSYWLKTGHRAQYPKLEDDIEIEAAVIGAGIAGILTAYHLLKKGKKVALFERFRILNGTTGNTTAKLSAQHGLIYQNLVERYDDAHAKLYYQANMGGINEIKKIAKDLRLQDVVEDETVYVYTTDKEKTASFKKEKEIYDRLGIDGDLLQKTPLGIEIESVISMNNQGILHPVEFLNGVLKYLAREGVKVYEHTLIEDMDQKEDKSLVLKTNDGRKVTCKYAVFATHYPQIEPDDHYDQLWARTTHALAYKTDKKLFDGAHIAYDTPSVTLRTMEYFGDHFLLIGGQSHGTGDGHSDEERYEKIHQLAQEMFPVKEPFFKWCAHDLMTKDKIPFIGKMHPNFENAYTITGLNAWGLANSSAGAMVLTDMILGKENPYVKMYDPFREIPEIDEDNKSEKSSSSVAEVATPKVEDLKNDQMTIVEKGEDKRIGVYRDKNGKIHSYDLTCTHHGCGLQHNDGDKTWDCPCHGSRFDKFGRVIFGPALNDLEKRDYK